MVAMTEDKQHSVEQQTTIRKDGSKAETIRFVTPKGQRKPKISVIVGQEVPDMVTEQVGGFVSFLREHAIVGLAVGFVIATQVQGLVKQIISSLLDPISKLLFGTSLSEQSTTWHFRGRAADIGWGQILYTCIDFFFVVIAIYIIIRFFKLDKLDKPKDKTKK
jgi:large-conductance mechanosensitive channel